MYMHTCVYTYMYNYICIYIWCIYIRMRMCMYIYIYVHLFVCVFLVFDIGLSRYRDPVIQQPCSSVKQALKGTAIRKPPGLHMSRSSGSLQEPKLRNKPCSLQTDPIGACGVPPNPWLCGPHLLKGWGPRVTGGDTGPYVGLQAIQDVEKAWCGCVSHDVSPPSMSSANVFGSLPRCWRRRLSPVKRRRSRFHAASP